MARPTKYEMNLKEVAEVLVAHVGATSGHWGISVRFGLAAANLNTPDGEQRPTALVPIMGLGVQQFEKPNSLTVDAAEVQRKHHAKVPKPPHRSAKLLPRVTARRG